MKLLMVGILLMISISCVTTKERDPEAKFAGIYVGDSIYKLIEKIGQPDKILHVDYEDIYYIAYYYTSSKNCSARHYLTHPKTGIIQRIKIWESVY